MSYSTTEQQQTSKDKGIIQEISFKDFSAVCKEYQQVERSTKKLVEIANTAETPVRVKVDIHKWIIEMNIGKPKQMSEINTNPITLEDILREFKDEDEADFNH